MSKVKLNIRDLSVPDLIVRARQIGTALTNNPNFTTPQPPVTQITTATDDLEVAQADLLTARQIVLTKGSILREKQDALTAVLRQTAGYIESVAGDDEKKILSAGFGIRSASTSIPVVTAPTGLSVTAGDHEGELDLSWDKVKNAKSYVIERSPDPPTQTSWVHATVASKSSATINGLTSGTRYWFRVATVSSGGQSGWSDPAVKIAP